MTAIKHSPIWFLRTDKEYVRHLAVPGSSKPICATSRFKNRKGTKPGAKDKTRDCRMCANVAKAEVKSAAVAAKKAVKQASKKAAKK